MVVCRVLRVPTLILALILLDFPPIPRASAHEFPSDGRVIELDDSNFDSAISAFDYILVDFYAPWCGHCKRLAPELDAAAPVLSSLKQPIAIAKIDADKYRKLASKYDIDGFPTLKVFMHGTPIDYRGPRKHDLLIRFMKKFVAPDVTILEQDADVHEFVKNIGTDFPIFVAFGLNESTITQLGKKYKKKAWFSVANRVSDEMMVTYDFDKVPALVSLLPKYDQRSVFYGPFEEGFLEDFIKQNLLPLAVPVNYETIKLLADDNRKIVLTVVADEVSEEASRLTKILKSAASANRDLVFAYVGVKQWEEFAETFDATKKNDLPKLLVWDGHEEYFIAEGLETLKEEDQSSQISWFLQAFREGNVVRKKISGPSFTGFLRSLMNLRTLVIVIAMVIMFVSVLYMTRETDEPIRRPPPISSHEEERKEEYKPDDKED